VIAPVDDPYEISEKITVCPPEKLKPSLPVSLNKKKEHT
jgi:hypothetical protein